MSDDTMAQPTNTQAPTYRNRRARRALAFVLVVLVILLGVSMYLLWKLIDVPAPTSGGQAIDTKGIEWVRSIYGTSNRAQDLFGQTQAAVPSDDGTIWVTDSKRPSRLLRFSPDGQYLGELGSLNASMPISSPSRIAVGSDRRIYIVETTNDRIHVLWPNGKDGGTFSVPKPVSVAVSDDRILVGSLAGFAVLDKEGKPIGVFGTRGKGPAQFDYVHGVAFGPDGSIYVTDSYNNRVRAYESNGKPRWVVRTGAPANAAQMTSSGLRPKETSDSVLSGSDALQLPLGMTVDGAGRLVIADMFDCTLTVLDSKTGKVIGKYGDVGAADGQFFYPVSVGYDTSRDWFTVADAMNRRVQIVRIPGSAGSAGAAAAISRALSSPLRACLFPLLLLLLAIATYLIARFVRRRRARVAGDEPPVAGDAAVQA